MTLAELAARLEGELVGDGDLVVQGLAGVDAAGPGDVTFAETPRLLAAAEQSQALAVIAESGAVSVGKPLIRVPRPRLAFARALELFAPHWPAQAGLHPTALIGDGVELGEGVSIGAYAIIGDRVVIGPGAAIHPLVWIGAEVKVGPRTVIHPGARLHPRAEIGADCILHSGAVIGADGFGFVPDETGRARKIPQIGTVIIADDVEVGANTTIDRATTGATVVGRGTKIDNLVHIAHNVQIGEGCLIVAQVGISGSVQVGDGVIFAGQVGVVDHVTIGTGARLLARAAIFGDVPAGATVSGTPAHLHTEQMRIEAAHRRLPEILRALRRLERRLAELERGK